MPIYEDRLLMVMILKQKTAEPNMSHYNVLTLQLSKVEMGKYLLINVGI
jgi:hypothetical protein